jgi:hypothetical protein
LPLAELVLKVAVYYRADLTIWQLGRLFGVSSSRVCRVIQRLDRCWHSNRSLARLTAPGHLWTVDGNSSPSATAAWASCCSYRCSANVQIIVDAERGW